MQILLLTERLGRLSLNSHLKDSLTNPNTDPVSVTYFLERLKVFPSELKAIIVMLILCLLNYSSGLLCYTYLGNWMAPFTNVKHMRLATDVDKIPCSATLLRELVGLMHIKYELKRYLNECLGCKTICFNS